MKKTRQENLELLRCISMFLIITLHFCGHGGVGSVFRETPSTIQRFLFYTLESVAVIAVNCYILISGYFFVNSKFSILKVFKLLTQVWIYSILIYILLSGFKIIDFSIIDLLQSLFPTITNSYWFVTVYIAMYLLSPFLNIAIMAMTKKQHFMCCFVLVILFSFIPNFIPFSRGLNVGGYGIVWFVVLFIIGSYIRKYYIPCYKVKKYIFIYILITILLPISEFTIKSLAETGITKYIDRNLLINGAETFYQYNSILVLGASVMFFLIFINVKIHKCNKIILFFAAFTFDIYLIHDNQYLRPLLWNFIGASNYINKWYFPFFMVGVIVGIFMVGCLIGFLRKKIFEKLNVTICAEILVEMRKKIMKIYDRLAE